LVKVIPLQVLINLQALPQPLGILPAIILKMRRKSSNLRRMSSNSRRNLALSLKNLKVKMSKRMRMP
jgi:hypothetical protein